MRFAGESRSKSIKNDQTPKETKAMNLTQCARPQVQYRRVSHDPLTQLQHEIDRLFGVPFADFGAQFFNTWAPALDVFEDAENVVVSVEVPGLKNEDFNIALIDGVLSVSGERRLEEKRQKAPGYRTERFSGRFQRSVKLPKAVQADKVRATYKDGVLTVTLPIAETARPKQITVASE